MVRKKFIYDKMLNASVKTTDTAKMYQRVLFISSLMQTRFFFKGFRFITNKKEKNETQKGNKQKKNKLKHEIKQKPSSNNSNNNNNNKSTTNKTKQKKMNKIKNVCHLETKQVSCF